MTELVVEMVEEADNDEYDVMVSNEIEMGDPLDIDNEKSFNSQQKATFTNQHNIITKKQNVQKRQKKEVNLLLLNSPKLKHIKNSKGITKNKKDKNKNSSDLQTVNEDINKENSTKVDPDQQFLLSLLPTMKELTDPQKWQFKTTIINELRKLRFPETTEKKPWVIKTKMEIKPSQQDLMTATSSRSLNIQSNDILFQKTKNKFHIVPASSITAICPANSVDKKVTALHKALSTNKITIIPQEKLQLNGNTSSTNNLTSVPPTYIVINENTPLQKPNNDNFIASKTSSRQQENILQRTLTSNRVKTNVYPEEQFSNDILTNNFSELPQSNNLIESNNSDFNIIIRNESQSDDTLDKIVSEPIENLQDDQIRNDTNENTKTALYSEITVDEIKLEPIKIEVCDEYDYYYD